MFRLGKFVVFIARTVYFLSHEGKPYFYSRGQSLELSGVYIVLGKVFRGETWESVLLGSDSNICTTNTVDLMTK